MIQPVLVPVDDLDDGGLSVPVVTVDALDSFAPATAPGASAYRHTMPGGQHIDALLVNQSSDVLVVSLHGALNRNTAVLPRFERLRSINRHEYSSIYFADPALHMHPNLQLAWFVGWEGFDFFQVIADWTVAAARAVGATHVIFSGSSGGGFASLQVAPLVPGSLALAFNPQTSIAGYLAGGHNRGPQQHFLECVWPQLVATGANAMDASVNWTVPLGERASALERYARPVPNFVLYVENRNDFHYSDHYLPFLAAAARGGNLERVRVREYEGPDRHETPYLSVFHETLDQGAEWLRSLPEAAWRRKYPRLGE